MARHVAKFLEVTPSTPKVIGADTPNYKPIFDAICEKFINVFISTNII